MDRTLPNGLRVILRESHDAPLASIWTWYRVGSRNELPGKTGVSHWVEHMQFKGTPTLAKGAIFRDVSKEGGTLNAMTSNDWTVYFETLPADRLALALVIESDRMRNSLFAPEETESERTVILSERQGGENNPAMLLYEDVLGTAFRAHPYRHMVIGHEADLRALSREDLYQHYQRFYQPSNAFITAVGDFSAEALYHDIEARFGPIPASEPVPQVSTSEPPQRGERRVTLRIPAPTAYLQMVFHVPPARHPDTAALVVADAVLSGAKGMGFGGGGPMGRSSRLYRALVTGGLARSAGSDVDLHLDAHLFTVSATALPGSRPEEIEGVALNELARLAEIPVPDDELGRAQKQLRAQYQYSQESVTNQAFWLGQMEIVDGYQRVDTLVDELNAVTADDIQRVASTYFTEANRTVGWLIPSTDGGGADGEAPNSPRAWRYWSFSKSASQSTAESNRRPFGRIELGDGAVLLGQARPDAGTVAVRLRLPAGAAADPSATPGLASFTARMLQRGTGRHGFAEINELTDGLGASISSDAGRRFAEISVRCLREDLPTLLDLAAEIVREPAFPDEEIERVRQEILTSIREQDANTRTMADLLLRQQLYPARHPYHRRRLGTPETVSAITRADLVEFHHRRYGLGGLTIAAVGGYSSVEALAEPMAQRFSDWTSDNPAAIEVPAVPAPMQTSRRAMTIPGKSQADLALGYPTVPRDHPDFYALLTGNLILGQLGLMGRLGANVRDKQGLAYYVFSSLDPDREASLWVSRAGVDPANVERAIDGIIAEVRRLQAEPVSADELADAKSFLTGSLPLSLETAASVASLLLMIEQFNLGLDYLDRYPGIINALTHEQLQAAARAHLDPDRFAIGIAGPA